MTKLPVGMYCAIMDHPTWIEITEYAVELMATKKDEGEICAALGKRIKNDAELIAEGLLAGIWREIVVERALQGVGSETA